MYVVMAASLKEIILDKFCHAPCFGLQFDETADFTSQPQLIANIRFSVKKSMKIVDHYLLCLFISKDTTTFSVFSKLHNYFSEHGVTWSVRS